MTNQDSKTTSTSKINDNAYRYFNSGIHEKPYFTTINNLLNEIKRNDEYDLVKYDQDLFKRYYGDDFSDLDEIEQNDALIDYFWEKLSYWEIYFQPLKYNEEIAHECGLIPFKYNNLELLALGGCGMDLFPRLDAYQALTDGTIDKQSKLFREKSYFEQVVGTDLTKEVIKVISGE